MTRLLSFLLLGLCLTGCHPVGREIPTGDAIAINNVFADPSFKHSEIQNVLLLPIDNFMELDTIEFHRNTLTTSVLRNFGKFNYFNVFYDRHFAATSGRIIDLDAARLDRTQLGEVGVTYGVQALLQLSIDEFQAYPPMRMKVKATLYNANTGERFWAFDHVFDTDDAEVVNSMRLWWNGRIAGGDIKNRFEVSRVRPTLFANYVFYTMAQSYGDARMTNLHVVEELREKAKKERREQL
jgi:TolB-like protein